MISHLRRAVGTALLGALGAATLAACGGSDSESDSKTVTVVSHDSFEVSKTVLSKFTAQTGYKVKVVRGADAGAAVNQAILSKGNPQGDVFFGVDNTLLSRALDEGVFTKYRAKDLNHVPEDLQLDAAKHRVTPVDTGDICVNYDRKFFADKKLAPPKTFNDLIKPQYKNMLVTENAATSSPGLAFLLGTVGTYGDDGWQSYWKKLKDNGVEVVDGWEQAYNDRFSGSGGGAGKGDKPLVVSYASSPPAEVVGVEPQPKEGPTGVAAGTCFRQIEFAGLLDGAKNAKGGKALLDFMLSKAFQEDVPVKMYVNPVRKGAKLPEVFTKYGQKIAEPATVAPEKITKNREQWIKSWTSLVVR
ncbi:thiamine ABC transporter substrate-binding protein [Streptomyces zagrosensis]|uniref:Thiamine transport system substrate-binding protein n=1 Tax=Streptomyces zagrosensis TaxID=1042984 RepID=A0A7W9UYJ9_9ACTN|nr:thiamine ABC transporter substrate-binding protein [Streptomyces zagrosensis]MBB5936018.1 thiamine transport system substrate-binding protein [Streptomyces zagrosensis]